MSDPVVLLSTGDVVGPAGGVTDNSMVLFSGTSGKLIKGNNAVVTAAGLALLDDVNAAAQRTTLGLGTAATATLTTSATDTTAGRVTKVGDFGLGAVSTGPFGQNLNSYTVSGFYQIDPSMGATSNNPTGNGYLILQVTSAGDIYAQSAWDFSNGRMWTRTGLNQTWTPWREIAPIDSPAFTGIPTAPTPSAGTRSTAIATMQNFANEFGSSLAANGYQKLPSGLIIQWGRVANASRAVDGTALGPISYPISFPNAVFAVNAQMIGGEAVAPLTSLDGFLFVKTVGTSSFNLISGFSTGTTIDFGVYWRAEGY